MSMRAACSRSDRKAPARSPGPACYGQGSDSADADRRQPRPRPHQRRAPDRREACAARCRGAQSARSATMSAGRSGSAGWLPRRRSCASPMPRWRVRSASSRSSAGMTRHDFAAVPFGGGGRAARRRADQGCRAESGARAALSGRHRRHSAASSPTSGTTRCRRLNLDARWAGRAGARGANGRGSRRRPGRRRGSGPADRADRHGVRARHALCRSDPHRLGAAAGRNCGTARSRSPTRWCAPLSSVPTRPRSAASSPAFPPRS